MDFIEAIIRSSSPFYLVVFLPFIVLFWTKGRRMRVPVAHLGSFRGKGILHSEKLRTAILLMFVSALIITLTSPAIPTLKTVVVQFNENCDRDLVLVIDISASMIGSFNEKEEGSPKKFDAALGALYNFAKGRSSDCFTTILFSGSSGFSYPSKTQGYAFIVNSFVKDPDTLMLALQDGIDRDVNPTSQLLSFSQGTEIDEGLIIAEIFFEDQSIAKSKVLILISDLATDTKDTSEALETLARIIEKIDSVHVFGVAAYKGSRLYGSIQDLDIAGKLNYFDITGEDDFRKSYEIIDRLDPEPAPLTRTEIVSVQRINFVFLWVALGLWVMWFALEFRITRMP